MKKVDVFFLLLAVLLTIFLNLHYITGLYYDHDVSSYAYNVLQVLSGKAWYNDYTWGNKPPGINFIFLLAFSLLGKSFISIQIFSLIFNLSSVILLYFLARQIFQKEVKLYFLLPLFYALFSISEAIQGHSSNTETFLNTFEIAGMLCLGLAYKNKKDIFYIFSGLLLGSGFLIKQSALATLIAGLIFVSVVKIIYKEPFRPFLKTSLFFISSFLFPLSLLLLYFLYLGVFKNFIDCVFIKNIEYIKNIHIIRNIYLPWGLQQIWKMLKIEIIIFGLSILIGLCFAFAKFRRRERLFALSWFIIPSLIISRVGFHFRHHFLEILAPLLTLSVIGFSDIYETSLLFLQQKKFMKRMFAILGICVLVFPFLHSVMPLIKKNKLANSFFLTQRYLKRRDKNKYILMLFKESPDAARRFLISQYIKEHTSLDDKIFVWDDLGGGAVYLWAGRDNATSAKAKFALLPINLRGPTTPLFLTKSNYRIGQERLLEEIVNKLPVYIVVIQDAMPIPNTPFSPEELLFLEKEAFRGFFNILEKDYQLETEIMGCQAYRRK